MKLTLSLTYDIKESPIQLEKMLRGMADQINPPPLTEEEEQDFHEWMAACEMERFVER